MIIMDEPTSAISDKEVDVLFDKIRELRRGTSVIIFPTSWTRCLRSLMKSPLCVTVK